MGGQAEHVVGVAPKEALRAFAAVLPPEQRGLLKPALKDTMQRGLLIAALEEAEECGRDDGPAKAAEAEEGTAAAQEPAKSAGSSRPFGGEDYHSTLLMSAAFSSWVSCIIAVGLGDALEGGLGEGGNEQGPAVAGKEATDQASETIRWAEPATSSSNETRPASASMGTADAATVPGTADLSPDLQALVESGTITPEQARTMMGGE